MTRRILLALLGLCIVPALANANEKGNGGDTCENRFQAIRDDIRSWIRNGGARELQLPQGISSKNYSQSMLRQIKSAIINCTNEPIFVGRAEKTCKNYTSTDGTILISCNTDRFLKTAEADQYVLVHHEYAGLAGFEENIGEESEYSISNQLTSFLEDQIVKKLAVKPRPPKNSCTGSVTKEGIRHLFSPGKTISKDLGPIEMHSLSRDCNSVSGCGSWQPKVADLDYRWCSPNCDYDQYKRVESTTISSPTSSYFSLEGAESKLVFSFNLSDSKGREHIFTCEFLGIGHGRMSKLLAALGWRDSVYKF